MSDPEFASSVTNVTAPAAGSGASLTLTDLSALTKLTVKTSAAGHGGVGHGRQGPAFGSSQLVGQALVCGSRPDEWLVIGDPADVAAAVDGVDGHVIDLTHGRLLLELRGSKAARALEKICSLDWSDDFTPDGAVVSASVAKVVCDIVRHDRDGEPAYLIAADRSVGQYLYEAVAEAMDEFNH